MGQHQDTIHTRSEAGTGWREFKLFGHHKLLGRTHPFKCEMRVGPPGEPKPTRAGTLGG